jgi:SPP1 family predicted phage head-tail adaptor
MSHGGLRTGTLNRKIDFYKIALTTDSHGQAVESFTFDFSAMADVRPIKGSERAKHDRSEMTTLYYLFKIHFTPKVKVTHKILFNGDYFNIQGFAPMGSLNRRFIELTGELLDASKIVIP